MSAQLKVVLFTLAILILSFGIVAFMNGYLGGAQAKKYMAESGDEDANSNSMPEDVTTADTEFELLSQYATASNATISDAFTIKQDIEGDDYFDPSQFAYVARVGDSYFDTTVFIGDGRVVDLSLYGGRANFKSFATESLSLDKISTDTIIPMNGTNLTVVDAINNSSYNNYYIAFGLNEIALYDSTTFANEISALIDTILAHNSKAIVYVVNVSPTTADISNTTIYNLDNINAFNYALKSMCQTRNDVVYLDLASSVKGDDGFLSPDDSPDGMRMNASSAAKMVEYIRQHVVERTN